MRSYGLQLTTLAIWATSCGLVQAKETICLGATAEVPGVKIQGDFEDLVSIFNSRQQVAFDGIRDGNYLKCGSDVVREFNAVGVRHGNYRDIMRAYGIVKDEHDSPVKVIPLHFEPRNGNYAEISVDSDGAIKFHYGQFKDLTTRFCFKDGTWFRSQGEGRPGDSLDCFHERAEGSSHVGLAAEIPFQ